MTLKKTPFLLTLAALGLGCSNRPLGSGESDSDGGPGESSESSASTDGPQMDLGPGGGCVLPDGQTIPEDGNPHETADGCASYVCSAGSLTAVVDRTVWAGDLVIAADSDFAAIDHLECIRTVQGSLIVDASLATDPGAAPVTSLDPLVGLSVVEGDVVVALQPTLASVELPQLLRIGGDLVVEDNDRLASLGGLSSNLSLLGGLRIVDNAVLGDLDGLQFVACPGCARQEDRPGGDSAAAATGTGGFTAGSSSTTGGDPGGTSLYGDLEILDNPELTDMSALHGLGWVWANLRIERNARLPTLTGLVAIRRVDADFSIRDNVLLPTNTAEQLAALAMIAGTTTICGNLEGAACPP